MKYIYIIIALQGFFFGKENSILPSFSETTLRFPKTLYKENYFPKFNFNILILFGNDTWNIGKNISMNSIFGNNELNFRKKKSVKKIFFS